VPMTKYRHMMPLDADVWGRYLEAQTVLITQCWYDVHVGRGMAADYEIDPNLSAVSQGVSRKRIDVVAEIAGGFWVIEVKPLASMQAIGQVICYTNLFLDEFAISGDVQSVIICAQADDDLLQSYDRFGVGVIVV